MDVARSSRRALWRGLSSPKVSLCVWERLVNIAHHRHLSLGPWKGVIEWRANRWMGTFPTLDAAVDWFWTGPDNPGCDDASFEHRIVADSTGQAVMWLSPNNEVLYNRMAFTDEALACSERLFPESDPDEIRRLCWLRQVFLAFLDE